VRVTGSVAEAQLAVREMLARGVNVLAVAGGDGSLHHALQPLSLDGGIWPGVVVPLAHGTMNIVATSITRSSGSRLERTLSTLAQRPFGAIPRKPQRVLAVSGPGGGARYGFVFGSELVKNALEMYEAFGGGSAGLARLLFETTRGPLFQTELWKKESWRLTPPETPVLVDGRAIPRYAVAFAATCDLATFGGSVRALVPPGSVGFSARVITEMRTTRLIRMIPSLMRLGDVDGVSEFREARTLALHGGFTLDGEVFDRAAREPLTLSVHGPLAVLGEGA
jgi:hypothetical protein